MFTSVVEVGTTPELQFDPKFQFVLVAPVQSTALIETAKTKQIIIRLVLLMISSLSCFRLSL